MYKIIQVHASTNNVEFRVRTGKTLHLVLIGTESFDVHVTVRLMGKGASAFITGICLGSGNTKQLLHTIQYHEAPDTMSDLLIKTVLSDHSKFFYDGGIRVEKIAQKTNAYQRNENLLLSGRPYAESKPSLEILANDVRCTHGATTGPIDQEQLWYLSSRGMSKHTGEKLITQGFIQSALPRIGNQRIIYKLCKTIFRSFAVR